MHYILNSNEMERTGVIQVSGEARRGSQSPQAGRANNIQGTVHSFGYCVSMVSWSQKKRTGGENEGSLFLSILERFSSCLNFLDPAARRDARIKEVIARESTGSSRRTDGQMVCKVLLAFFKG